MIIIIILFLFFFLFVLIKTKQTCGCVFILLYRVCLFVIIYSHLYYYFPPLPPTLFYWSDFDGKDAVETLQIGNVSPSSYLPAILPSFSLFPLYFFRSVIFFSLPPLSLSLSLLKLYFNVLIIMMMIIIISGASERMVAVSYRHKWFDSQLFLYRHNLSNVSLSLSFFFFFFLLLSFLFVYFVGEEGIFEIDENHLFERKKNQMKKK